MQHQPLGVGYPVVHLAVQDQGRGVEIFGEAAGRLLVDAGRIPPRLGAVAEAAAVGHVGGELGVQVVDPGVVDDGGEAVGMAEQPGDQIPAVGAAGRRHPFFVDVAAGGENVDGAHHVVERLVAMPADDRVGEGLAEAGRAVEVGLRHDVALGGEKLGVPAVVEVFERSAVRPAVQHHHQRPFLLGIEARREVHPHLHRVAAGAFVNDRLDLAGGDRREPLFIVEGQLLRLAPAGRHHEEVGRLVETVGLKNHRAARRLRRADVAAGRQQGRRAALDAHRIKVLAAPLLGGENHGLIVGQHLPGAGVAVPVGEQLADFAALPVVTHQVVFVGRPVGPQVAAEKQEAAVGRILRRAVAAEVFGADLPRLAGREVDQLDVEVEGFERRRSGVDAPGDFAAVGREVPLEPFEADQRVAAGVRSVTLRLSRSSRKRWVTEPSVK